MKYCIQNGLIYDGTGNKAYQSDILIEEGKITRIAPSIQAENIKIIQADGSVVTPGFIDTHRHCDLAALYDPDFGTIELSQGLTSVVGGNCGLGIVPTTKDYRKEITDFVEPCLGVAPKELKLESYSQYMKALETKGMPLHVGSYIGTGAVKAAIKGYNKSPFTRVEMDTARGYIREQLEAGALGLSMGIMYQPECYSTREEIVELLSVATSFRRPLTCHIRGEGDNLVPSVKEMIEICKRAELPLNISHFKATGLKNWGKNIHQAILLIEEARNGGQEITVDFYPYCGGSTTLISLLPPSVMLESMEATFHRMESQEGKAFLKKEIYKEHQGWDNMVTAIGWERILVSSVTLGKNSSLSGLNFREASDQRGYEDPCDLMAELLVEESGKVGIIVLSMSQEDVDTVARLPYSMIISDSLYGVSDCPHPRLYGSFPKIIREYVMERKVFTMEEAIRKMTSMPSKLLSLSDRGIVREGAYADLLVFKTRKLRDHAVYENSKQLSTGLSYVFVDGRIALQNDKRIAGYQASILQF